MQVKDKFDVQTAETEGMVLHFFELLDISYLFLFVEKF